MIKISCKGDFKRTTKFLTRAANLKVAHILEKYAQQGVNALSSATPKDTGETAGSWGYEIKISNNVATISWTNSKMAGDTPLVILLQFGHGTGTGGYVQGRDFINPAMRPVFDKIADDVWREVVG